jgi:asparagine synthase (glutamine-hydrolysing)
VEEAVETRLMSDVPLGMFLSGGVDSSAIAALIRRKTSGAVKTFSVGYREAEFSELAYAAEVARAIGTEHHETVIGMEDFFQALPELIWHEDEPIAWPSSVSLYFVSRLAAQQVKVVLTGEGADELFAGYKRYAWQLLNERGMRYYSVIPRGVREWVRGQIANSAMLSASVRRKLSHTFVGRRENLESVYLDSFYGAFSAEQQTDLLGREPAGIYGDYLRYWSSRPQASSLQRMLYADQKTYLVELLMKQDQMSMACSIESRVPFLDHPFVEFAMRVPDGLKIRGNTQKYILKKAVEDLIPHEILHRKKMGFPTPLSEWFRDRKAGPLWETLCARDGFLGSYLNLRVVKSLIERQSSGFEDGTDRLWRLLNLQIWGDIFITGRKERWRDGALVSASATAEV